MESILMNPSAQDFSFLPLQMRRHRVIDGDKSRYRVYHQNGEFRTIEAKTAYEAFKASGFKEAARIVRVTRYVTPSLHKNELSEVTETPPLKAAAPVAPAAEVHPEHIHAPKETGAHMVQPSIEAIDRVQLAAMEKTQEVPDGIEEISAVSTPIQVKVPQRSLESEAPGAASPQKKPERTMLSVQDIDKLLGK